MIDRFIEIGELRNTYANIAGDHDYYETKIKERSGSNPHQAKQIVNDAAVLLEELFTGLRAGEFRYQDTPKDGIRKDINVDGMIQKINQRLGIKNRGQIIWAPNSATTPTTYNLPPLGAGITIPDSDLAVGDFSYDKFKNRKALLHELGHATHFLQLNPDLPYDRKYPDMRVTETVAFLYEFIGGELISPKEFSAMLSTKFTSMSRAIIWAQFEKQFYSSLASGESRAGVVAKVDELTKSDAVFEFRYWYASDYTVGYPAYWIEYFPAYFAAGQLADYFITNYKSLANPVVGKILNEKIFKIDNNQDLNTVVKSITGEDLNPRPLFALIKKVGFTDTTAEFVIRK